MNTQELPRVVGLPLAARVFQVPARWLREEVERGRLPALQAGRSLLFNTAALERALAERAAQTPANGGAR